MHFSVNLPKAYITYQYNMIYLLTFIIKRCIIIKYVKMNIGQFEGEFFVIIDFHTHIYPKDIADKATKSVCDFYHLGDELHKNKSATAENLIEAGKKGGVDKFVILPVAIKPEHVQSINNFAISEEKAHSEFYAFGTLHAAMNNPMLEIERISADVKGIKFHPDTQLFNADDDRLLPVFDAIQGRLPVLFHCGDTRFDYSHPKRIKRIIEMFPKLTVIAAHLGGWSMYETGYELLKNEDCYFDLSSSLMFLEKERAVRIIRSYGSDRVLFGTDFPLWSPAEEVERFLSLGLTDEENERILYKNALRLLEK